MIGIVLKEWSIFFHSDTLSLDETVLYLGQSDVKLTIQSS